MDQDNKAPNNILQFPGRKKEAEAEPTHHAAPATAKASAHQAPPVPRAPKAKKASKKTIGGSVLAVMLFTGAINHYVYNVHEGMNTADLASNSGRQIASVSGLSNVDRMAYPRNADWEKDLAEKLASPQVRDLASVNVGRSATMEEKLRWGTLEEKYTITYKPEAHQINSILLQDSTSNPAYILDRPKFLNEYGQLFDAGYRSAKLKSVETSEDKTVESYTLYDREQHAKGEARFELDRHKRLISLKVEPSNI